MNKIIAMIPVRMGSQRLKRKNMQHLQGIPLVTHAIRKCIAAGCFDEIWVNSESIEFQAIALDEGAYFHNRPQQLGDNETTSEQFISEFLETKDCTHLVQVHSIAPLLSKNEISAFVEKFTSSDLDVLLSAIEDQIEVAYLGQQ
jgi:CMP-N-acetylneuraminic acid synthetase